MIRFVVYGKPETKGSTKAFVRGGRAIITNDNPKTKAWQTIVAWEAQRNRPGDIIQEAVEVTLKFYFVRPKSVSVKKRPYHTVKPDIDKITRAVLDGLKGTIFSDDSLVTDLIVRKRYGDPPRCEIEVKKVDASKTP
jgi:Holliday junction resolvase RusA-like endonuclease